jgi:hypothetical protein
MQVGDFVIYVDPFGVEHDALLTAIHGKIEDVNEMLAAGKWIPCVNVLYVLKDEDRMDGWGRQIGRESSVSHQSSAAHGRFWKVKA